MIWSMITGLLPDLWLYLAAAAAFAGAYLFGRRGGADRVKRKQAEAVARGVESGAKGAAKAETQLRAGKTPEEIVRGNDNAWD